MRCHSKATSNSKHYFYRLDEAIREIRKLEESNADLEVRLHRANTAANLSESAEAEVKIYNQKLNSGQLFLVKIEYI